MLSVRKLLRKDIESFMVLQCIQVQYVETEQWYDNATQTIFILFWRYRTAKHLKFSVFSHFFKSFNRELRVGFHRPVGQRCCAPRIARQARSASRQRKLFVMTLEDDKIVTLQRLM